MRRSHALALIGLAALGGCTQSLSEAVGELRRPLPPPQQAQAPAPAPAPPKNTVTPPPPPQARAEPKEERGGFRLPGFGRRDSGDVAQNAPRNTVTPPPPPAAQPKQGGGFRIPGFGGGAPRAEEPAASTEDGKRSRGILPRLPEGNDPVSYRPITFEGLARGVRDDSMPHNIGVDITATVDARFVRQIVIDLRGGGGLAVSRREGDCIQVLLPWQIDQNKFDSGRYRIRGIYRRTGFDQEFVFENNRYQMSCGDAYLFVKYIERAP
jgi:hypothetical protein